MYPQTQVPIQVKLAKEKMERKNLQKCKREAILKWSGAEIVCLKEAVCLEVENVNRFESLR